MVLKSEKELRYKGFFSRGGLFRLEAYLWLVAKCLFEVAVGELVHFPCLNVVVKVCLEGTDLPGDYSFLLISVEVPILHMAYADKHRPQEHIRHDEDEGSYSSDDLFALPGPDNINGGLLGDSVAIVHHNIQHFPPDRHRHIHPSLPPCKTHGTENEIQHYAAKRDTVPGCGKILFSPF
jgi:hypothetical protein